MLREFGFHCCLLRPLFLQVLFVNHGMLCYSAHQGTRREKKSQSTVEQTAQQWIKSKEAVGLLRYCTPISSFGHHLELPVNRIDWTGALCFPSPFSLYNCVVMSHVSVALPWVSLNLRAQWLHHGAILHRRPGINLPWKQLAMKPSRLEKFWGWQLPWSAVTAGCLIHTWTPHQERVGEREVTLLLCLRVEC